MPEPDGAPPMMDRNAIPIQEPLTVCEIKPGLWADPRHALWMEEFRTLVLSDLHLGFAWVQRSRGQLIPLKGDEAILEGMDALLREYRPATTVLLGDIVHATVAVHHLIDGLSRLLSRIEAVSDLVLVRGNHDQHLDEVLHSTGPDRHLVPHHRIGPWLLHHGHEDPPQPSPADTLSQIIGHEHPSIQLPDSLDSRHRLRCFLAGPRLVILPAFSPWANGMVYKPGTLFGPAARREPLDTAVACLGRRSLAIPLAALGPDLPCKAPSNRGVPRPFPSLLS